MFSPHPLDDREIPPMSAEMFSALVTARLRPLPDIQVEGGKGMTLQLRVRGQPETAQLERAYAKYRAAPETLMPVIAELIQTLTRGQTPPSPVSDEFARLASQLFPQLMTAQQWRARREQGLRLVIRPLAQDLGMALVLDRGSEIEYAQIEAIPTWGVDASQAYETALQNLERKAREIETVAHCAGAEILLMDHTPDGYAAARALLPTRWRDWQARVTGELVLALPTRDLSLGFSRAHPALAELSAQARADAATQPNGLFPHLLHVRDGALEILAL